MPIFSGSIPINWDEGGANALSDGMKFSTKALNAAWLTATQSANAFDDIVQGAVSRIDAQTDTDDLTVDAANATPVVEPVVTIPTSADPTDVMSLFDTKYTELVALLVDKFTTFQNTYFPNESANYALAETWIADALSNPNHGIPAAVAAQLMTDVKSRAYADMAVQSDAVLATFAARRFPLPPGAAASAVLQISQKTQDGIAEASRKLMIGYIEQMKFAVEKTLSMRQEAMNSAIAYINALASGPSMASGLVGTGYDAQSKLISATASFYNARTDASRLLKQAEQFNVEKKFIKDEKNVSNDMTLAVENVKLLLTEAQALAQIATALFNNVNISTSVQASDDFTA
jgi:hypothetical protein